MSASPITRYEPTAEEFIAMHNSEKFHDLKKTFRSFAFPMSILFFLWYLVYLIAAVYLPDFYAIKVFGGLNLAFLLGFAQIMSTFVITWLYIRFANKHLEPRTEAIRNEMENPQ